MPFGTYSATPSANTSIAGNNIGPGGPPGAIDNAIRQIMADARIFSDGIPATQALANQAILASITLGVYPVAAATNVPRGLLQSGVGAITPGSAGTNGTFAVAWTGGNFAVNPTATFTVAGNVLTAFTVTGAGLYFGASPTVPTPTFAASAGLTGAAVALSAALLVASGSGYWVTRADGTYLDRYVNDSGTATATPSVASVYVGDMTNINAVGSNIASVVTAAANLAAINAAPAAASAAAVSAAAAADSAILAAAAASYLKPISSRDDSMIQTDPLGWIGAKMTTRGLVTQRPDAVAPLAWQGQSNGKPVLHHMMTLGQSLSNGFNALPVITTAGMFTDAVMFNAGVNTKDVSETPSVSMNALVPYFEQTYGSNAAMGESPCGGAVARMTQVLRDRHGMSLSDAGIVLGLSCAGTEGVTISAISKPSVIYSRVINQVTAMRSLAIAAGYEYRFAGLMFDQGQFDNATAVSTWASAITTLQANLQTDLRAITGGTETVRFFMIQTWIDTGLAAPYSHGGATLAQLQVCEASPDKFIMVNPVYQQTTIDGTHHTAFDSNIAGAYWADAYLQEVIYGGRAQRFGVKSVSVNGAVVTVSLNPPSGEIAIDAQQVRKPVGWGLPTGSSTPAQGKFGLGFVATDRTGALLALTADPVLVNPTTVQFTLAAGAPGSGLRVKYADFNTQDTTWGFYGAYRRAFGARGCIRDTSGSQPTGIFRHPSGRQAPLHRWLPAFDKVVIA